MKLSKYKKQKFSNVFGNSFKGIKLVLKSERNIKIHFLVGAIAVIFGILLKFSIEKLCILFLTIGMVIISESLNSAIEFSLDAIFKNKYSRMVGMAKDIAAGAVMIATFLSIIIGILLFFEPLVGLIKNIW